MSDATAVIERYFAIWNEPDQERRRALIAETWTDDATYLDPMMAGDGPDGIDAMIAGVQQQATGLQFRQVGTVDSHNDRVRFSWELVGPNGGEPVYAGTDFATLAADGRLQTVTGFLDRVPS